MSTDKAQAHENKNLSIIAKKIHYYEDTRIYPTFLNALYKAETGKKQTWKERALLRNKLFGSLNKKSLQELVEAKKERERQHRKMVKLERHLL